MVRDALAAASSMGKGIRGGMTECVADGVDLEVHQGWVAKADGRLMVMISEYYKPNAISVTKPSGTSKCPLFSSTHRLFTHLVPSQHLLDTERRRHHVAIVVSHRHEYPVVGENVSRVVSFSGVHALNRRVEVCRLDGHERQREVDRFVVVDTAATFCQLSVDSC